LKNAAIEIEIDAPHNDQMYFRPLHRSGRGRYDVNRVTEPMARLKATEVPAPIPSQRIGIDTGGNGFIKEPLHEPAHKATREKLEKRGMKLAPAVERFENIDVPSWLFWLVQAVKSGIAKVVAGTLPETIDGKPQFNFITGDPPPSPADNLTAALNRQAAAFEGLTAAIGKLAEARK